MAGVKAGQLHQGIFNPNPYNYLEATVKVPKYDKPILIVGRTDMNRATSGDAVAIELLPQTEWKRPTDNVVERSGCCWHARSLA
jgi:exosome complex exonuclease DIS3/RRP44